MSPIFTPHRRQPQIHQTLMLQCHNIDYEQKKLCETLICLVVDMGPAVFRCPGCDALWCIDPLSTSTDEGDIGIMVFEDLDGHRIESFDQRRSRPILRAWDNRDDEGLAFLMRKQGQCRKIWIAEVP